MIINKLWVLPVLSSEIENGIKISNDGMDMILSFDYLLENGEAESMDIKFEAVLCHMHTSERFTPKMLDAYDTLVSVEDSDWLHNMKKLNSRDFEFWKPSHFAIYFDGVGLYQFIARKYTINKNGVE